MTEPSHASERYHYPSPGTFDPGDREAYEASKPLYQALMTAIDHYCTHHPETSTLTVFYAVQLIQKALDQGRITDKGDADA